MRQPSGVPASIVRLADGRLQLSGDLLFGQAVATAAAGKQLISSSAGSTVVLSLAGLARINSVSAAVLIEWRRVANAVGKTLVIEDVPPQLAGMLLLSGLDDVLGTH